MQFYSIGQKKISQIATDVLLSELGFTNYASKNASSVPETLLFYHYVKGFSVEKCAEMMDIGRTSAFRLKKYLRTI